MLLLMHPRALRSQKLHTISTHLHHVRSPYILYTTLLPNHASCSLLTTVTPLHPFYPPFSRPSKDERHLRPTPPFTPFSRTLHNISAYRMLLCHSHRVTLNHQKPSLDRNYSTENWNTLDQYKTAQGDRWGFK